MRNLLSRYRKEITWTTPIWPQRRNLPMTQRIQDTSEQVSSNLLDSEACYSKAILVGSQGCWSSLSLRIRFSWLNLSQSNFTKILAWKFSFLLSCSSCSLSLFILFPSLALKPIEPAFGGLSIWFASFTYNLVLY